MTDPIIEAHGLTKRYGDTLAVDHLDLRVRRNEIFGLLGPNGSGKTTTILMMLGLTEPTTGQIRVAGRDPMREPLEVKRRVGYVPDAVGFYDQLSAEANLEYTARLAGIPREESGQRIAAALRSLGLDGVGSKQVRAFSRGMCQRLALAEILIRRPQIAILDEPTVGLDPEGAREFLGMIRELKKDGLTVLLSSHLLDQVQTICDRVGLFHRGRIALEGTVQELSRTVLGNSYRIAIEAIGPAVDAALSRISGVSAIEQRDKRRYRVEALRDVRPDISEAITESGGKLLGLTLEEWSLDDIYTRYFERVRQAA
ncbi:MAG TPA: ABC transporter ATP-binding protein [Stellaceae bacterium]|nr:ABC transporter ATP-binding protein [Stellaceae bacterium]